MSSLSNELSERANLIVDLHSEDNQPPAIQSRVAQAPSSYPMGNVQRPRDQAWRAIASN